jgi:hypothetical protein
MLAWPWRSRVPAPYPILSIDIEGKRAKASAEGLQDGRAGWGREFCFNVAVPNWDAGQQFGGGGGWYIDGSVRNCDLSMPRWNGGGAQSLDAQVIQGGCDPDDIANGIGGSNFMKVNFLKCAAMHFGFGFTQFEEYGFSRCPGAIGKSAGVIDDGVDVVQVPVLRFRLCLQFDMYRAIAAFPGFFCT